MSSTKQHRAERGARRRAGRRAPTLRRPSGAAGRSPVTASSDAPSGDTATDRTSVSSPSSLTRAAVGDREDAGVGADPVRAPFGRRAKRGDRRRARQGRAERRPVPGRALEQAAAARRDETVAACPHPQRRRARRGGPGRRAPRPGRRLRRGRARRSSWSCVVAGRDVVVGSSVVVVASVVGGRRRRDRPSWWSSPRPASAAAGRRDDRDASGWAGRRGIVLRRPVRGHVEVVVVEVGLDDSSSNVVDRRRGRGHRRSPSHLGVTVVVVGTRRHRSSTRPRARRSALPSSSRQQRRVVVGHDRHARRDRPHSSSSSPQRDREPGPGVVRSVRADPARRRSSRIPPPRRRPSRR